MKKFIYICVMGCWLLLLASCAGDKYVNEKYEGSGLSAIAYEELAEYLVLDMN